MRQQKNIPLIHVFLMDIVPPDRLPNLIFDQNLSTMMKRISFACTVVCLIWASAATAQSSVGIRAGILISKQQFKEGMLDVDPKSKFGADLALIAEFGLGEVIAISPEFHWLQKGAKIEDIGGTFEESSRTFNYLEIPVLLKLKFDQEGGFFFFAGPSIGYLFDATDKDGDGNTEDIDLADFKRAELGAHLGGGIGIGPLKIDVRYIIGFSNIADYDGDNLEVRNSGFGAGVAFIF
jgi:hypothetical protein